MRLEKCNMYTANEMLRYRGRKTYTAAAKREEQKEEQTHKNNLSSPMRRREEPIEEQK